MALDKQRSLAHKSHLFLNFRARSFVPHHTPHRVKLSLLQHVITAIHHMIHDMKELKQKRNAPLYNESTCFTKFC